MIGNNPTTSYITATEPPWHPPLHDSTFRYHATFSDLGEDVAHRPRVAYMAFTHLNGTQRFENMILGSIDTWLPNQEQYYVVLSNMWKQQLQDLLDGSFSSYKNRIHAVFVDCPEGKFGLSPCCKQEQGLLYLWQNFANKYEWFAFMDDDIYTRATFLEAFVSTLPANHEPIVLTSGTPPQRLGQAGYLEKQSAYKCSNDHDFIYPWASLAIYNRIALRRISNGLRLGGLSKQCREFRVTHDTGNAILHWMYSIPSIHISVSNRPSGKSSHSFAVHGVGRCKIKNCSMNELHRWYQRHDRHRPNLSNYRYIWHNVSGFKTVQHYKEYGDPASWTTEWHTMPISACAGGNLSAN